MLFFFFFLPLRQLRKPGRVDFRGTGRERRASALRMLGVGPRALPGPALRGAAGPSALMAAPRMPGTPVLKGAAWFFVLEGGRAGRRTGTRVARRARGPRWGPRGAGTGSLKVSPAPCGVWGAVLVARTVTAPVGLCGTAEHQPGTVTAPTLAG